MTKPFSPSELVARVKAHLARYERLVSSAKQENDVIEIRGIKIDKTARRVFVNGEEKVFTTKEFDLLTFLAEHPNHVRTNCLKKSGIWILSVILQPLPCISKRFVKRLSMIRQSRSILKPSGVSDTDLKCNIGYDNSLWCFAS